jgi:hypothetical protein
MIFDFRFFSLSCLPGPLGLPLGPFQIFTKIAEIFATLCLDTGDKLFTSVKHTGDKLLPVLLTPVNTPCPRFSSIL